MISFNMLEVARIANVKRFFYASSACIYPEYKQLDVEVEGGGLKEGDAWPAQPQDAYGKSFLPLFSGLFALIWRKKRDKRRKSGASSKENFSFSLVLPQKLKNPDPPSKN